MKTEQFTFSTLEYKRPDFQEFAAFAEKTKERIEGAGSYAEIKEALLSFDGKKKDFSTDVTIASIRHTLDTRDKFYEGENEYIEETFPTIMPCLLAVDEALMNSPFRADFEKEYGRQYLAQKELEKKAFCEANIPLMQREAKLASEYEKMMATAEISFDGKVLNLFGVQKYFEHEDREMRKGAVRAYSDFYHKNEQRLEEIWEELLSIRNEMGRNLGYEDYIPVGYMKQGRTDYGQKEVESFREQVRTVIVPICERLYEAQAKRLGVEKLAFYDEKRIFPDGNAVPAGDDDFMVREAAKMYHEMSPETGEFIDFMIQHELMDLKNKPGKAATGYMTDLQRYQAPFVFSCFNQTIGDMGVLTHELGHAFAGYLAMRSQPLSDYYSESTDIAEIHSMSMEQFAYPYAERFFGDGAEKFLFAHLQEAVTFVPFGVAVDEFQHICYANPDLTPKERTLAWKKLEEKYMPWRTYEPDDFFDRGGWWYHKIHIFLYPFYYINYTLTTMGAMEFKKKEREDHESAWKDYLNLCKCGGSMSYLETLRYAGVSNPFEEGSVEKAISVAKDELMGSRYMREA
ncbi:MAG: M3 family oligoendopeptidase [Lachnospiraceae bacterium]|nr:M3 family oligoendopeptidase [Lachnospiraceae bacterium]